MQMASAMRDSTRYLIRLKEVTWLMLFDSFLPLAIIYPMFDCAWLLTWISTTELALLVRASNRAAIVSGMICKHKKVEEREKVLRKTRFYISHPVGL